MTEPFAAAHIGHFVLTKADTKFADYKADDPDKKGRYPKKKVKRGKWNLELQQGRDFYDVTDEQGNRTAFGYKSGTNIDGDGPIPEGMGLSDGAYQGDTSYHWGDGTGVSAYETPYVVLPQTGGPFDGVKAGDYVKLTNSSTGQSTYAIVADNGNRGQAGEMSVEAARRIGVPSDPNKGGMDMTTDKYVQWEWYPGSGKRDAKGRIEKQTADQIQTNGRNAAAARSAAGGKVIIAGERTVLVSKQLQPIACVGPRAVHTGNCPMATGSATVSVVRLPVTRVGDSCTCGQKVISGENSVKIFGPPTSKQDEVPSSVDLMMMKKPIPNYWPTPKWADTAISPPGPFKPSTFELGNSHF